MKETPDGFSARIDLPSQIRGTVPGPPLSHVAVESIEVIEPLLQGGPRERFRIPDTVRTELPSSQPRGFRPKSSTSSK